MAARLTRICWHLTQALYLVGLFLPRGANPDAPTVGRAALAGFWCGLIRIPFAIAERPGDLLSLPAAALFALVVAHPSLWWAWLAFARRAAVPAAAAAGIAAFFWILVGLGLSQRPDPTWLGGGWGY
jgi:hypothetical protein